jgi:predicted transposase YbfD/YdcC
VPPQWESALLEIRPRCRAKSADLRSLADRLREELPEFRRAQSLGYPVAGLVALTVMAMVTGVRLGAEDLADYAETLSQAQLTALRFRRSGRTGEVRCPKRGTFQRMMAKVDGGKLERALLVWQEQVLGPAQDKLVIVDGKKMRHGHVEIVNACNGNGRFLGSVMTESKSNEIPAARELLAQIDLGAKTVLMDALHTQCDTARQIVFDQGGHYLMTVKENQPGLVQRLEKLFEKTAFSPTAHAEDASNDA